MTKNYYMHLMDGAPAYFDKDTRELYFITQYHKLSAPDILYHSLEQLKKDQKEYRNAGNWRLSYLRIPASWEEV